MEYRTLHETNNQNTLYGLTICEDDEANDRHAINTADIVITIDEYIDSRAELRKEIRKRTLVFLKKVVADLENEISKE
ncbi:TPA: hypothetical protein ACNANC_005339 [Klebsiella oxytoca]